MSELKCDELKRHVDEFWKALELSWDIEPRSFFEAEAEKQGWKSPLAMAVHYMWKRDTKPKEVTGE